MAYPGRSTDNLLTIINKSQRRMKMARDYQRDYTELVGFSKAYQGKTTLQCIEDYSRKRKIVCHRTGKAFWSLVDQGKINVEEIDGICFIR